MTPTLAKDDLEEEYERFVDSSVWDRTEILEENGTRYFIAWLRSTEGVDEMVSILRRLCSNLKYFFQAASDIQRMGEGRVGKLEAWLEARICIGSRGRKGSPGCFTLRLDPGSRERETITTTILSPGGDEIGACVIEL